MAGPSGEYHKDNPDGTQKDGIWWRDDGVTHRESYTQDKDGNVLDYHYGQRDNDGTQVTYNFLTGEWEDNSR